MRLNLGPVTHSITWIDGNILIQVKVDSVIMSLLLDGNANLGLAEEYIISMKEVLQPLCAPVQGDDMGDDI